MITMLDFPVLIRTQPGVHLFTQISTTNITFLQVKGLLRQAADREREQEKEKVNYVVI